MPILTLHASKSTNRSAEETWKHLMKLTDGDGSGDGMDEGTKKFPLSSCDSLLLSRICMQSGKTAKTVISRARMISDFPILSSNFQFIPQHLLVRILLNDVTQGMSDADLLKGILRDYVLKASENLGWSVAKDWFPNLTYCNSVIRILCWELGVVMDGGRDGEREGVGGADKALRLFCVCCKAKSFAPLEASSYSLSFISDCVAEVVSNAFLSVMSHLHKLSWHSLSSVNQQLRARTLRAVVCRMKAADVAKFLPKILMFLIDVVGGGERGKVFRETGAVGLWRVKLEGVKAWKEVCDRLSTRALCDNLSALLVGLYPLLERASEVGDERVGGRGLNTNAGTHGRAPEQSSQMLYAQSRSNWWEEKEVLTIIPQNCKFKNILITIKLANNSSFTCTLARTQTLSNRMI